MTVLGLKLREWCLATILLTLLNIAGCRGDLDKVPFINKIVNSKVFQKAKRLSSLEKEVVFGFKTIYGSSAIFKLDQIEENIRSQPNFNLLGKQLIGESIFENLKNSGGITKEDNNLSLNSTLAILYDRFGLEPKIGTMQDQMFVTYDSDGGMVDVEVTGSKGFGTNIFKDRKKVQEHDLSTLPSFVYSDTAKLLIKQQKYDTAIEYCKAALEINPNCASAHMGLAICFGLQDDLEKAIEQAKKAIELDPCYTIFYKNLASLYCVNGDYREAGLALNSALYFARFDVNQNEDVQEIKGIIDLTLGDLESEKDAGLKKQDLKDLIFLPKKVKDNNLFKTYTRIVSESGLIYKVDFKWNSWAYSSVSLGDLVEEETVFVKGISLNDQFRRAERKDNGEYYFNDGKRVRIETGTMFYVPLEEGI